MLDRTRWFKIILFVGTIGWAEKQFAADENKESPEQTRPEEKKTTIPDDTFSPSESVSEDYPVPFPTDI